MNLVEHTHLMGGVALAVAALVAAARRWWAIALLLAAMTALIRTDANWAAHDAVRTMLMRSGRYGDHVWIQVALLAAAALLLAVAARWVMGVPRGGRRWAWVATVALVALFVVQSVSLHTADVALGHRLGPVMLVGWLWLAGALLVVAGAVAGTGRSRAA